MVNFISQDDIDVVLNFTKDHLHVHENVLLFISHTLCNFGLCRPGSGQLCNFGGQPAGRCELRGEVKAEQEDNVIC